MATKLWWWWAQANHRCHTAMLHGLAHQLCMPVQQQPKALAHQAACAPQAVSAQSLQSICHPRQQGLGPEQVRHKHAGHERGQRWQGLRGVG